MKNPEIDKFGTQKWYNENEQLHRLDGPALIHQDGTQFWYQNNKLHRIDGPAAIFANGKDDYYLYNKEYKKEDFLNHPEVIKYNRFNELL